MGMQIKTADFLAQSGGRYQVDTSNGPVTVTLPLRPTRGDHIDIEDAALTWATHNVTLARNGVWKINSAAGDYTADVVGGRLSCVYISAAIGWSVK